MKLVALTLCLLLPGSLWADTETEIAIALALAESAASGVSTPDTPTIEAPEPARPQYTTRQVIRYRTETRCMTDRWGRKSCRTVRVPYTVTERVPVSSTSAAYPIRGRWWTGCRDYRHLLQGEHAKYRLDPAWLRQLSNATIQSIHSDLHEGKVRRDYLVTLP